MSNKIVRSVPLALFFNLECVSIVQQMMKIVFIVQPTMPVNVFHVSNHIHFKRDNVFHVLIIVGPVFLVGSVHLVVKVIISSRTNLELKLECAMRAKIIVKIVLILLINVQLALKDIKCQAGNVSLRVESNFHSEF